jgi:hypothetical protein
MSDKKREENDQTYVMDEALDMPPLVEYRPPAAPSSSGLG